MSKIDAQPLAIVTGVGPGTGSAIVRRFAAGGYRVAMLARDKARLDALSAEIPSSIPMACDVSDSAALARVLDEIDRRSGPPKVVVHNAVGGAFGKFQEVGPEVLRANFETNVMALLHLARHVAPPMIAAGGGALLVTGNTSALRGKANFAGFAPTKAAQRILAESIARDLGPQGIHVAYLVIDAVIDVPWQRERMKDAPDDFFIKPAAIAEEIYHIAHQDRSAWSFLAEVRPYREPW
ncbi:MULTISPECIES: SDR family NAD(P)-dependent oxidoreductase [unclassified Bradyrhizobium]|uniref:SDR family NAD(P)-dependent oxidoreductase n=1 Tax=unclassified Bradyrhizobium TaxID=2631580 RepID=UPI002915FC8F|nr:MULTISPECIES: SDR family NAD(P)-dependent oxidoreductase [unclassified Bradyrhizobium]